MDPEEIDATVPPGTHVEHRDGHSVVHLPTGPVTVAHAGRRARVLPAQPVETITAAAPRRVELPTTIALPEMRIGRADVEAERAAYHADLQRRAAAAFAASPQGRMASALSSSTAPVLSAPGARVEPPAPAAPPGAVPEGTPAEWLQPSAADRMLAATREMRGLDASMGAPTAPDAAALQRTIQQGGIPEAPAPVEATPAAPAAAPTPTARRSAMRMGTSAPVEAPRLTAPQALEMLAGTPEAEQGFNNLIGNLSAGAPGPRRAPTLIDQQEQIGLRHAGADQRAIANQMALMQQQQREQAQLEAQRQAAMAQAQRAYQRSIDRVAEARLDPQRWFRDQGAAGTIGATLAVALGAVGGALQGNGQNLALDQINQAIERDLEAQQSQIDSGRAAADMTGNMLNITRQEYGDRQAALDAAHANMLDQVALQLQAMEADIASDEARVAAEQMRQQLLAQAEEARQAAAQQEVENAATLARAQYDMARARGATATAMRDERRLLGGPAAPRPLTVQGPQLQAYEGLLAGGVPREQAAQDVWGDRWRELFPGGAPQSTSTAENRAAYDALDSSLATLERVAAAHPDDIPAIGVLDSRLPAVTDSQRVMGDEIDNAVDLMGRLRSGAAISADEFDRFRGILGASGTEEQFRAGLARIRRELAARLGREARGSTAVARDDAEVGFSPE